MLRWLVVESAGFTLALRRIGPEGHDWSDSMLGVRWYLERDPLRVGQPTQDREIRILMWDTPDGLPDLKIFYLVGENRVTLLMVRAAPPLEL